MVEISEAYARDLFGATADEMIGKDILDFRLWDPDSLDRIRATRKKNIQALKDGGAHTEEYSTKTFDGRLLHLRADFIQTPAPNGGTYRYVAVQDQTDQVNANRQLRNQIHLDVATGLRNRQAFIQDFSKNAPLRVNDYGLFMCQLDSLSSINDAFSHAAGDTYIKSLAAMLEHELGDDAWVYRMDGDTFMIVEKWQSDNHAMALAEALQETVGAYKINVNGHDIRQSITIGAVKLDTEKALDPVLSLCQLALDTARKNGESQINFANANFVKLLEAQGAFITRIDIEEAVKNGEFRYWMQPVLDLTSARHIGIIAKIYWDGVDRAHIPQSIYQTHFTEIVLTQSHNDQMITMAQELIETAITVNSKRIYWYTRSRMIENDQTMRRIAQGFGKHPSFEMVLTFPAKQLLARSTRTRVVNNMHDLRDAGVIIALSCSDLDDLNILQITQLPIDEIILSDDLVEDITNDRKKQQRLGPIIELSTRFKINVIAENISTKSQLETVKGLGIQHGSGKLFAKAVALNEYVGVIETLDIKNLIEDTQNIVSLRDLWK